MNLRDYLLEAQPPNTKPVPILSTEGIKLIFDVVRNYALAVLVWFGAIEYQRLSASVLLNQPSPALELAATSIGWLFYGVAGSLFLLNGLFATYVFELTPFYRRRGEKFRWAIGSVLLCTFLSVIVCGAILLARAHAA